MSGAYPTTRGEARRVYLSTTAHTLKLALVVGPRGSSEHLLLIHYRTNITPLTSEPLVVLACVSYRLTMFMMQSLKTLAELKEDADAGTLADVETQVQDVEILDDEEFVWVQH